MGKGKVDGCTLVTVMGGGGGALLEDTPPTLQARQKGSPRGRRRSPPLAHW